MSDLTIGVSERVLAQGLDLLKQNFIIDMSDEKWVGGCLLAYKVHAHLEGGSIQIRDDGSVRLSELDLHWDELSLTIEVKVDLEEITLGGGCFPVTIPVLGQVGEICLPKFTIFSEDPVIVAGVDLAPFVRQEFSTTATLAASEWDPTDGQVATSSCQFLRDLLVDAAVIEPFPTDRRQWHINLIPDKSDLDLFDFPDLAANAVEQRLTAVITALIPAGPLRDAVRVAIGDVAELIRVILDIPDDIGEWLNEAFNLSFGLPNLLVDALTGLFGHCVPIFRIDNPFPLLESEGGGEPRISVMVPIENLAFSAAEHELMITADFGA